MRNPISGKTVRYSRVLPLLALAGLAGYPVTSAHAQLQKNATRSVLTAIPDQIIIRVPATYSDADVATLAATVNARVLAQIPYSPHFYTLTLAADTSKSARVVTRAAGRGRSTAIASAVAVQDTVKAAVKTLTATTGVAASPNYVGHWHQTSTTTTPTTVTPIPISTLEPNGPLEVISNDPLYYPSAITTTGQQWDMEMIHMPKAWAIQSNAVARTVIVADIDTGIDSTHPDLEANIYPGGEDFSPLNDDPTASPLTTVIDDAGHGSHTAGTIAAVTGNGLGVVGVAGWNRNGVSVKVLPIRLGGEDGFSFTALIAGINYAVAQKADVMNMSLGAGPYAAAETAAELAVDPEYLAILAATNAGITAVVSEGNDALDTSTYPFYPANYPNVINVSAVGPTRSLASYSNYGGNVAIAAPGGDDPTFSDPSKMVLSTFTRDATAITNLGLSGYPLSPVAGYETIQGTSMAAPHVTGAVALLIAAGATKNPVQIKEIIQATAQAQNETPNFAGGNKYGAGLLDVDAALATLTTLAPGFTAQIAEVVDDAVDVPVASTSGPSVGSSGYSLLNGEPYTDRGLTYVKPITPFTIRYVGRAALVDSSGVDHPEYVTLDISPATTPSTILRHYVGGTTNTTTTFALPTLPSSAASAAVVQTTTAPGADVISLPDGSYRATLKVYNPTTATTVEQGISFFELASHTQLAGRSMYSSPFLVQSSFVGTLPPELYTFGTNTNFTLARYNAQRLPTDLEYATYSPIANATQNPQAEFVSALALDGSPLSYLLTAPTVSTAPIGLGYWLDLASDSVINPTGNTVNAAVGVKLFAANGGWNMIGDPYTYSILWPAASVLTKNGQSLSLADAATQGIISPTIVGYSNGEYVYAVAPSGTVDPFQGYWVRAYQDCTLVFTPTGASSKAARVASRAAATVATTHTSQFPTINGWRARLMATVAGDHDGENYFGVLRSETLGDQFYSIPKPPSGAGHAYLRFVRANQSGQSDTYAVDMRKSATTATTIGTAQQTWVANVSTDKSDASVTLSWDGLGNVPQGSKLYLVDQSTGKRIAMSSRSSYTYTSGTAGASRSFQILLQQELSSGPLAIQNFHVTSSGTRAERSMSFRFTASREAEVSSVVRALNGKVVATIAAGTRAVAAQETQLLWNGKSSTGGSLPAGPYFVEVTLTTADGETTVVKQMFTNIR